MKRFLIYIVAGVLLCRMPLIPVYAAGKETHTAIEEICDERISRGAVGQRVMLFVDPTGVLQWFGALSTVPKVVGGLFEAAQNAFSSDDEEPEDEDAGADDADEEEPEGLAGVAEQAVSGFIEGAGNIVNSAQAFLKNLTEKLEDPELTAPDISPFDYVDGIDTGGEELTALRGTAASFYKLMLVLGAGGMVFSLILGFFKLGLQGERVRHEVIAGLIAKSAAVIVLTSFVAIFGIFGTAADQLAAAINSIP